ncbi:MAG: 40S ribosomal protein S19 [Candidatus Rehaiarchaeum fermentans]|nr:40S ribosomal protein S19 [Candidatus Rehaiarchaeum fermentans]MCW1297210.1 40S ribosomal protein S19 [Candidatus Rehaiarchaeum fermentans]
MSKPNEVNQTALVEEIAKILKEEKIVVPPPWADFVKTGVAKERPPLRKDWWYIRAASILRRLYYENGKPVGVNRLARVYGSKTKNTRSKRVFKKGSRNIIRKILMDLEKKGLIMKVEKGVHKGRILTLKGKNLIRTAANRI